MNHTAIASMILAAALTAGCASNKKMGQECKDCCMNKSSSTQPADEKHGNEDKGGEEKYEKISMAELPAPVVASFQKAYPGVTPKEFKKEIYPDGTVHYEIEFKGQDGKDVELEFDADGEMLEDH